MIILLVSSKGRTESRVSPPLEPSYYLLDFSLPRVGQLVLQHLFIHCSGEYPHQWAFLQGGIGVSGVIQVNFISY